MSMTEEIKRRLQAIPAIGRLLEDSQLLEIIEQAGKGMVKLQLKIILDSLREDICAGNSLELDCSLIKSKLLLALNSFVEPQNRRVINATGILLHTGLGRAPLAEEAAAAVQAAARYTPVQSDPVTGKRSLRESRVEALLRELTGAEAVTVVNNNAAATMLVLNTLACNKEVVISRGQLVEIGGAFRMPDVMEMSGAIMREVGTTNRTHLRDYRAAYQPEVGALIHVHTSNYRLRGFSGTPGILELANLARELGVRIIDDLGSGALVPLSKWGAEDEPLICDSIAAGVDLCCFSGDKLIGGAQSGIICGKREFVEKVRKNPFARMFRVDKLTLAALEATLAIWVNGEHEQKIPLYRMLSTAKELLASRAKELAASLEGKIRAKVTISRSEAYIGSGSLPDSGVESWAVVLELANITAEAGARLLRSNGVFSRINAGKIWIDMIALLDCEFEILPEKIIATFGG